ncbi:unnamed protein product [Protopolystoma xenopodis]|uniref:TOG domain-containing protein n=1 Tax=Protopolystoma xenopodis TaxID=117903 RepID=A0A448WD13_9PLAT|nr:unnamed protein product [Protopolystoma xenopodis]
MPCSCSVLEHDKHSQLVIQAGRSLTKIATHFGQKFDRYANACLHACLVKFKEKKVSVVSELRAAAMAAIRCIPLESGVDILLTGLTHANPSVRSESLLLVRELMLSNQAEAESSTRTPQTNASLQRLKLVRQLLPQLIKLTEDQHPESREAAFNALAGIQLFLGSNRLFIKTVLSNFDGNPGKQSRLELAVKSLMEESSNVQQVVTFSTRSSSSKHDFGKPVSVTTSESGQTDLDAPKGRIISVSQTPTNEPIPAGPSHATSVPTRRVGAIICEGGKATTEATALQRLAYEVIRVTSFPPINLSLEDADSISAE